MDRYMQPMPTAPTVRPLEPRGLSFIGGRLAETRAKLQNHLRHELVCAQTVQYQRSLDVDRAAVAHPTSDWSLLGLARAAVATGARPVLVIGTAYFVLAAWPLLFLRIPPYQDMPDHLATVS